MENPDCSCGLSLLQLWADAPPLARAGLEVQGDTSIGGNVQVGGDMSVAGELTVHNR